MTESTREWKPTPEAEGVYRRWLAYLNDQFAHNQGPEQRAEVVRDELYQIYLGRPHAGKAAAALTSELASRVLAETFDPSNAPVGLDAGPDVDMQKYAPRRPLIWFWQMFDRSPLGLNHWLGHRFRCMLGHHIFAKVGKGVKIGPDVRFRYGYNISIEDNCTICRGVVLDDFQQLVLPAGTRVDEGQRIPKP
jgi:hypothetical protein